MFFFFVCVALTVAVFLVEKSGRLLNLEEGRNTIAGTINTIMAENLSLPPVASQVFCVWLISPLLRKQGIWHISKNNLCYYSVGVFIALFPTEVKLTFLSCSFFECMHAYLKSCSCRAICYLWSFQSTFNNNYLTHTFPHYVSYKYMYMKKKLPTLHCKKTLKKDANNVNLSYILQSVLVLTSFTQCSMSVVFISSIFSFPFFRATIKRSPPPIQTTQSVGRITEKVYRCY